MAVLSATYMHDEAAAFEHVESLLWPHGPVCPHCGGVDRITKVKANPEKRIREGLWRCGDCKKQFTVKVGTVFEASKVPLFKWLQAVTLMVSSKKGISSHQLHRVLGITYKSAWFLTHRIRECMRSGEFAPMGGNGGAVEVDETFIGKEPGETPRRGVGWKMKVVTLVDRDTRQARSVVVDDLRKDTLAPILRENIAREARLHTDEASHYTKIGEEFAAHEIVKHRAKEYVRGEVTTNTVEGFYSIFKRGMKGVYQHCGKQHLHRYAAEFDFRYNNRVSNGIEDVERGEIALRGAAGKRLTYKCGPCT